MGAAGTERGRHGGIAVTQRAKPFKIYTCISISMYVHNDWVLFSSANQPGSLQSHTVTRSDAGKDTRMCTDAEQGRGTSLVPSFWRWPRACALSSLVCSQLGWLRSPSLSADAVPECQLPHGFQSAHF